MYLLFINNILSSSFQYVDVQKWTFVFNERTNNYASTLSVCLSQTKQGLQISNSSIGLYSLVALMLSAPSIVGFKRRLILTSFLSTNVKRLTIAAEDSNTALYFIYAADDTFLLGWKQEDIFHNHTWTNKGRSFKSKN